MQDEETGVRNVGDETSMLCGDLSARCESMGMSLAMTVGRIPLGNGAVGRRCGENSTCVIRQARFREPDRSECVVSARRCVLVNAFKALSVLYAQSMPETRSSASQLDGT